MNLEPIVQVVETDDEREANEYLDSGWVLLAITHGMSSGGDGDRPIIRYALGQLCPCPSLWKAFIEKSGGLRKLSEDLGLTILNLRLLARGYFQPQDSVVQQCRQLFTQHDIQPLL